MKMKRSISILVFLLFLTLDNLTAQTSFQSLNYTAKVDNGVNFAIRFQNKTVYTKDSTIILKASIKNNTPYDYIFELADDPFFNVDLNVSSMVNVSLPASNAFLYRRQGKLNKPILSRLISLKSGEEHSFEIVLNEYVDIPQTGSYVINAEFRPKASYGQDEIELAKSTQGLINYSTIKSESVILTVAAVANNKAEQERQIAEQKKNEILQREGLFPNQVVAYIRDALQTKQWNKYFLYLDLEQLFLLSADKAKKYRYADVSERSKMINEYQQRLTTMSDDDAISVIPIEYDIIKTSYTEDRSEVVTREVFRQRQYDEVKEYHWYLRKNFETGVWLVYDYYVVHLGNRERNKLPSIEKALASDSIDIMAE